VQTTNFKEDEHGQGKRNPRTESLG
jgi:hypothetical protein